MAREPCSAIRLSAHRIGVQCPSSSNGVLWRRVTVLVGSVDQTLFSSGGNRGRFLEGEGSVLRTPLPSFTRTLPLLQCAPVMVNFLYSLP